MSSTTTTATMLGLLMIALPLVSGSGIPNPILNGGFEVTADTGNQGYAGGALYWAHSHGSNARFIDHDQDGDLEAVVPADKTASSHNFWQSTLPPLQAFSADFASFAYTVESGVVPAAANNQIGLALTPFNSQHPWAGLYWEGAVLFDATAIGNAMDGDGRVALEPVAQGRIVCPDWQPCRDFKAAYDAADEAGKHDLLAQTRVIQVSFWNFNAADEGAVVIDDVAIEGAMPPTSVQAAPCTGCL